MQHLFSDSLQAETFPINLGGISVLNGQVLFEIRNPSKGILCQDSFAAADVIRGNIIGTALTL